MATDIKVKPKLIIITGSPCVGKTAVAERLFGSYENSAYFDGDWAWRGNPFSISDPRLRNGDKTMSFALSVYLNSNFDYVIFSSVVVIGEEILIERHKKRGDTSEVLFKWLRMKSHPNDIVINTDRKTIAQVAYEIKSIIDE